MASSVLGDPFTEPWSWAVCNLHTPLWLCRHKPAFSLKAVFTLVFQVKTGWFQRPLLLPQPSQVEVFFFFLTCITGSGDWVGIFLIRHCWFQTTIISSFQNNQLLYSTYHQTTPQFAVISPTHWRVKQTYQCLFIFFTISPASLFFIKTFKKCLKYKNLF